MSSRIQPREANWRSVLFTVFRQVPTNWANSCRLRSWSIATVRDVRGSPLPAPRRRPKAGLATEPGALRA
jgi:hypothetical protein